MKAELRGQESKDRQKQIDSISDWRLQDRVQGFIYNKRVQHWKTGSAGCTGHALSKVLMLVTGGH